MTRKEGVVDWVAVSRKENRELFSELDVLLRALDRFFSTENLTTSNEDLTAKNFYEELVTVLDTILRVLSVLEEVIPESKKNSYWFQKFAQAKLLNSKNRDAFCEKLYRQDTAEKGLYLLYDSFLNLKGVITDLIRVGNISYMGFMNIGHMIDKEIRENRYFNPFIRDIDPEFDTISSPEISNIVKGISQKELKKYISVIYLYLFRLLRFLGFVDVTAQRAVSLNSSLMILILLKSEISVFKSYIDRVARKIEDPVLNVLLKSIAYQFTMEIRRVYLQELRDIHRKKGSPSFRGRIENSQGILKNLTEHSIVQLTQFFLPEIKGDDIFTSFVTKFQQSLRLREDIQVLHELISILENRSLTPKGRARVFESIRNYMTYFESFTFRLLRFDDYEEFFAFFNELNSVKKETIYGEGFEKVLEKILHFKIYVETTLRHIENRSELYNKPLDRDRVESLIRQYL